MLQHSSKSRHRFTMPAKKKPHIPDPFAEHLRFYRQERKWFWEKWPKPRLFGLLGKARPESPEACDEDFTKALVERMKGYPAKDWMGLYRNDALTLACGSIARGRHAEGLDALLVTAFLDVQGADNNLMNRTHFDRKFSATTPIVMEGITALEQALGQDRAATEAQFLTCFQRFEKLGKPPFDPPKAWEKVNRALGK